ncbi:YdeI/OmpD-associated family protein [Paenibacillus kandeliae]|uniref:YdeI/OmpD-associated family protein n=1 Tax=Paenibacillus kandeliae TaxID=3231269 RepID=UPI00345B280D
MSTEPMLSVTSRAEWREWLYQHHEDTDYCWIAVSIKATDGVLLYLDAVEEALCFGWIDGVKKKTPDGILAQRMSPRRRNSSWTELNKERVRRLERLGQMTPAGRRVLPDMDIEHFVVDAEIMEWLQREPEVYANFITMPELYRRIRIDNIQNVRHQPDLFARRLDTFIKQTRVNRMYGQWHDHGRLWNEQDNQD